MPKGHVLPHAGSAATRATFSSIRQQLWISVAVLFLISVLGTLGYMVIEGWGFSDSLYMTIITLTTVGYEEVRPLDGKGRLFTIALILTGVVALGNLVNQMARAVSEGYFDEGLRQRRRSKMTARLKDHFIVCGYGRIGQQICKELSADGVQVVVVERDAQLARQAEESGHLGICGDASSDQVLHQAAIERASCVLCALPSDAENLYIVVSARLLNPKILCISRASTHEGAMKLQRVGADRVVSPYLTGAQRMAALALRPQVVDLIEATSASSDRVFIEEFLLRSVEECPFIDKTLREADLRGRSGALVLAVRRGAGGFIGSPGAETRLLAGDILICMGTSDQLRKLAQILLPGTGG